MGYSPPPPSIHRPFTDEWVAEYEINCVIERYVKGQYDEVELEMYIEFWLKWETLGPVARRNYELDWAKAHV